MHGQVNAQKSEIPARGHHRAASNNTTPSPMIARLTRFAGKAQTTRIVLYIPARCVQPQLVDPKSTRGQISQISSGRLYCCRTIGLSMYKASTSTAA